MPQLLTIVETAEFLRDAHHLFQEGDLHELRAHLSAHPDAGVVIPNSGGVRKLRWAASGRGKRGGARVIYYFHNFDVPLFLLAAFAKARKADLTAEELKSVRQVAEEIARLAKKRS